MPNFDGGKKTMVGEKEEIDIPCFLYIYIGMYECQISFYHWPYKSYWQMARTKSLIDKWQAQKALSLPNYNYELPPWRNFFMASLFWILITLRCRSENN